MWYNINMDKFKRGATSFYLVAFSTLIMIIIAASFATVIISEVTRSSNDDLSQSAYDAALAGVEDAKLAIANYERCVTASPGLLTNIPTGLSTADEVTCQDIVYWMHHQDCDMVAHILGRIGKYDTGEVTIRETVAEGTTAMNMNQAYTCVIANTKLTDYRANLNSMNNAKVIKASFNSGVSANDITGIKLSWYSVNASETLKFTNSLLGSNRVLFPSLSGASASSPPTLSLSLVQTADTFTMSQINGRTQGTSNTDRATIYLVPIGSGDGSQNNEAKTMASRNYGQLATNLSAVGNDTTYIGAYDTTGKENHVSSQQVATTNSDQVRNLPYGVYCEGVTTDFACSVRVDLPAPIGSTRNNDTFMLVVTLPYGEPNTDFSIEFICRTGVSACSSSASSGTGTVQTASIEGMQISIDSTGRANDLYRRVETRVESADVSFPYLLYALQLTDAGGTTLKKDLTTTCEYDYYDGATSRVRFWNGAFQGGTWDTSILSGNTRKSDC